MRKWDYEERDLDFDVVDDETSVYVRRSFAVYNEKLSELPRLAEAMEEMFEGLVHTELIEGVFDVFRKGPQSKPRFTVEITVNGSRRITEKEEQQLQREEDAAENESERRDLRKLRDIKERSPHLFKQL